MFIFDVGLNWIEPGVEVGDCFAHFEIVVGGYTSVIVIAGINHDGGDDLFVVAKVLGFLCGRFGLAKYGEEDRREDRDDCDDDE